MYIWVVKDGYNETIDYFATAEGAYSYMEAELERWNCEYPNDITNLVAYILRRKLWNEFKEDSNCFNAGISGSEDWFLCARRVEVKK